MVPLSMTLSDLWPEFQGHIFWSRISEKKTKKDKVTLHKKVYVTYGMVLCLVTLLTSKRVARVCQHQLSFLLSFRLSTFSVVFCGYSIECITLEIYIIVEVTDAVGNLSGMMLAVVYEEAQMYFQAEKSKGSSWNFKTWHPASTRPICGIFIPDNRGYATWFSPFVSVYFSAIIWKL